MTVTALPARLRSSRATSRRAGRDPAWARLSLAGLLAATLVAYLWDLGRNGYANDFYAAAVQAGTHSWKAFFFGSFDSANFITVDKTPASLWVMELSSRVFGFSSWSMLVPQALEGAGSVWLVYACVKRWFGPGAGLVSGAVLALTPVAALMFRFNNPDALLVLLMTGAGYAVTRALERDRTRWLVLAGVLVGLAFLAKMMQAFLVVPGFGLAYLWAGPARLRRRLWQLAAALGGIIAGAGWWVAIAQLWPSGSRPYFGGSAGNSILQLALGYNGLGRLNGTETGSIGWNGSSVGAGGTAGGVGRAAGGATGGGAGGPGGGGGFGGSTGILRLFHSEFAGQVSWLLPAALLALAALLWVSRRAPRADRVRAFALLWGGWLLATALTFSYMKGIIHPYYLVALAPAIAALIGVGAMSLFPASLAPASRSPEAPRPGRLGWTGRATAAAGVLMTAVVAFILLGQTPAWLPWLRWVIVVAGVLAAAAILGAGVIRARQLGRVVSLAALGLSLVAGLAGPLAYTVETVNSTHTGSIPSAGPAAAGSFAGPGGGQPGGARAGGAVPAGGVPGGAGGFGGFPGRTGGTGTGTGTGTGAGTGTGTGAGTGTGTGAGTGAGTGTGRGPSAAGGTGGGPGGLSGNTAVSSALIKLLEQDASKYKWIAATEGSQSAAPIELATGGEAVMAIGGFNGSDPAPTLAQFEAMVARHEIHYYVGRGSNSFGGGSGASAIESWVAAHFKSETVGGTTVYDLTQAK
jgi:4-amino-4-deoxy-L-arabinose transferase-like glycosyltransferase